ncbi:MAG TPA: T9SS type A sorting domain-containing protein [Chitinophagales bacterium]|nr:T9SS type A sorting domain-containing protein [Chitinophagales bacterium]
MFPNPANKTLTISIAQFDLEKDYLFKAWAMNGTLIAEIKLIKDHDYTIAINEWSSGIYLCEVSADGEVLFTDKLIKE